MKKNRLPAPLPLGRVCAALILLGSWKESKASLLGIAVAVLAVLVLIIWLSRRRRRDSAADSHVAAPEAPPAKAVDLGATQIEGVPDGGEPVTSTPSPGLHGKIEVLVNGQSISSFLITDNPLPIGRDPGQSLVIIQEPIVSKLHCQIFARGGQVFVKDLNSTNGVYVNNEKVGECALKDNDEVFLGKKGTVRIIYHR
jgi:hypothetical protein